MTPDKFTLLIVDVQNDLTLEDGAMYVPTSKEMIQKICEFIRDNKNKIDRVILAKSNHPESYCGFVQNGGAYPKHCVEKTSGSNINKKILNALKDMHLDYIMLNHGEAADFDEPSVSKYSRVIDNSFVLATATDACRVHTDDIVICGITGDVMVAETVKDLAKQRNNSNIYIFMDGVASVNKDTIMDIIETYHEINII